jgi:hypothetical protein
MRLNEINNKIEGEVDLLEGVIPVHLTMTLEQVVRAGKITNNVQTFIMADLMSLFREGTSYRWSRDINSYPMNASADMINLVRDLPNEEVTALASWLLEALQVPASYESNPFAQMCNPQLSPVEWMKWVLKRQD